MSVRRMVNSSRAAAAVVGVLLLVGAAAPSAAEALANPFEGREDLIPEGKTLFNVHCSHCHGPNAIQGERPRDLRRLNKRYGADMANAFYKTATTGRPDKGMPNWTGVLEDEQLWKIFTFLQTVQKK